MPAFLCEAPAAMAVAHRSVVRSSRALIGIAAAVLLAGCNTVPEVPFVGADPADAAVPVPAARPSAVTAGYASLRPAAPTSWRQQNERVTPRPKNER